MSPATFAPQERGCCMSDRIVHLYHQTVAAYRPNSRKRSIALLTSIGIIGATFIVPVYPLLSTALVVTAVSGGVIGALWVCKKGMWNAKSMDDHES